MRQSFQPIREIDRVDRVAVLIDQVTGLGLAFDELGDAMGVLPRPKFGVPTAPLLVARHAGQTNIGSLCQIRP